MSVWLLIEGDQVIDGSGASPTKGAVLTCDNTIAAVGPSEELLKQVPRGDETTRLSAEGCTVMPGLIDAHCHMTFGEARTEEEIDLYTSVEMRTLIAANNLQKVLRAGVTSISERRRHFLHRRGASRGGRGRHDSGTEDPRRCSFHLYQQRTHRLLPRVGRCAVELDSGAS